MNAKILVVDDEPNIVKLLDARLSAFGYEFITAYDGQDALDKAFQEKPDLIILDIMLPKIDGYKVCTMLRTDTKYEKCKNIPIVMLTARKEIESISKGMALGAVSYIQKPFQAEVLLGIVKGLLGK